jgi:hypothetical protein
LSTIGLYLLGYVMQLIYTLKYSKQM